MSGRPINRTLRGVKAKSFEKKDLLTPDEFNTIVDGVLQKTPA